VQILNCANFELFAVHQTPMILQCIILCNAAICAMRQMVHCDIFCSASFWCGASFCAAHKAKKTGNIVSRNRNIVSRNRGRIFCRSKAFCAVQKAGIGGNIVSRNRNIVSRNMNIVSRKYDCSTA
jgi:hypothetical protein